MFDAVVVSDRGAPQLLSPEEFYALPLHERVRLVLERRVRFLRKEKEVDPKEALAAMRLRRS